MVSLILSALAVCLDAADSVPLIYLTEVFYCPAVLECVYTSGCFSECSTQLTNTENCDFDSISTVGKMKFYRMSSLFSFFSQLYPEVAEKVNLQMCG